MSASGPQPPPEPETWYAVQWQHPDAPGQWFTLMRQIPLQYTLYQTADEAEREAGALRSDTIMTRVIEVDLMIKEAP